MTKNLHKMWAPILIIFLAFLSFNNNFFLVTSERLFVAHQLDSEQLVLDGILRSFESDSATVLGRYSRPEIENQSVVAHRLYANGDKSGEFKEYKSQLGLQLYFFKYLAQIYPGNVKFLQSISALLMSVVVGLFYFAINREFSHKHAVFFCAPLIFSPWVVVFARNLYWVEATWFLPAIITLFIGKRSLESVNGALTMGGMLFLAFLLKFLCGYEYLTTIALSACAPLVYYTVRYKFGGKRGLSQLVVCGISLSLAFIVAMGLHARTLSADWDVGLDHIVFTAKKRLSSEHPDAIAKASCKDSTSPDECEKVMIQSLTSNRFLVAAKYFIVPHFLPWADRVTFNSDDERILKEVRNKPTVQSISAIAGISSQSIFFVIFQCFSILAFIFFNLVVWRAALRRRDSLSVGILVSFLAPLSWFILAKGHAYAHYHVNYVLWYLLYIPFGMLLLLQYTTNKPDENRQ